MKKLLAALGCVVALAGPASAATTVDLAWGTADFAAFNGAGDLMIWGADAYVFGDTIDTPALLDLMLSFDLANPVTTATGYLDLSFGGALLLDGMLGTITQQEDQLTMVFDGLTGTAASAFGPSLTFELAFVDPLGAAPVSALVDGTSYDVVGYGAGSEAPAVPLPATLPLLLAGLGALGVRVRAGLRRA
ncbi:PEP-CTERM sorting domain-containing protein [Rhodobacter maris]|uniref:Secreted protein n=1 Tax=Rhodobacter maris TaxID=446682 RepID=A0A285S0J3_9RHOB|nr:PEP-CTERM sorting domain-containing protein [Rhodobacter maris]SOB99995.1 hypothetical protein SAMN05877831_102269 [Rhodobacter maris]